MPLVQDTAVGGAEFDGTADTGLFAIPQTGAEHLQIHCNTISFHATAAIATTVLTMVDPDDAANATEIPEGTGTATDFLIKDLRLPTTAAGVPWELHLVTTGNDAVIYLNVDYDFVSTPG